MSRDHLLHSKLSFGMDVESLIINQSVPCRTIASVLRAEAVAPKDLVALLIDAEGYDAKILASVDLSRDVKPFLVVFEHKHLKEAESRALTKQLFKV